MNPRSLFSVVSLALSAVVAVGAVQAPQKPQVQIPNPGVPQIMTLEDRFVRVAYNNEGYVSLGYQLANTRVGEEWMFLEVGAVMREGRPAYKLKRSDVTLTLPDNSTLQLPSNNEYRQVDLRQMENQAKVIFDTINYFPPSVRNVQRIGFFSEISSGMQSYDEVELSSTRASVGRWYFKVPGGLKYGQHFLNVKFPGTVVRVPFRIVTKEEEEFLNKNWKDIRKQIQEAFKKGK
jgi:hypothetical protein